MEFHADERILFETAHSILIMMILTPTKSIEPYQVLFEKNPILQARLEKKQKHVNSFTFFYLNLTKVNL